jgi:proline iminopeptidase
MTTSKLYPEIEPFATGWLEVDSMHTLYWEQCGNPDGVPILFVHGGPGAGCSARDRRFFDPEHFRIILMDQRGAPRSKPAGEIRNNTTENLVADFELLRQQLEIDRWHVFGGSWGSTLGIVYAQAHPGICLSLVLRGIWLFREQDLHWWFYDLAAIQPEHWRAFSEMVPESDRADLSEGYWKLLTGEDKDLAQAAARRWSEYEINCCTLLPCPEFAQMFEDDKATWALARIEAHYFRNNRPQTDNQLLDRIDRLRAIPAHLVHGRYDVICPVSGADELHRAWPETSLSIIADAGHSSIEPGITTDLVQATDRIRDTGSPVLNHGN